MAASIALGYDDLACFVAVAERLSFTAAAKHLGLRKATVSRHVQLLERRLGAQLVARTTRSVRVTDAGHAYLAHARQAIEAARAAERAVAEARSRPAGVLRLTTTSYFGDVLLAPVLLDFLAAYPDIAIDLELSPDRVDLVAGEFDVAIRFGALADSELVSRRLGSARLVCVASPAYLARAGTPTRPDELPQHATIGLVPRPATLTWTFVRHRRRVVISLSPRLVTTSRALVLRAATDGVGIARLPELMVRRELRDGALVSVLDDCGVPDFPVHLVMPRRTPVPARTRAFVDHVVRAATRGPLASLLTPDARPRRASARTRARG